MKWRDFWRPYVSIPDSLLFLWKRQKPSFKLSTRLSNPDLFNYYLYLDYQSETRDDDGFGNHFWKHFHTYGLARRGLAAGTMEYAKAREFLYDALSDGHPEHILDIYLFWLDVLKPQTKKSLEAWSDRKVTVRKILETLKVVRPIEYRAEFLASLLETAADEFTSQEKAEMLSKCSNDLVKKLPAPTDFARFNHQENRGDLLRRAKKNKGNNVRSMMFFVYSCLRSGNITHIQVYIDYLRKVLWHYDPVIGDTYATGSLMALVNTKELFSEHLRTDFMNRVVVALPKFEHGIHERDNLLGDLVRDYADLGELELAYLYLEQITEQTSFLHAAGKIMGQNPNPDRIEAIFENIFLPLVAKRWNRNLNQMRKRERRFWMLHWLLSGHRLADKGDFSILNREDLQEYVEKGNADFQLENLAETCAKYPEESRTLRNLVVRRITAMIHKYHSAGDDGEIDYREVMRAIESILILRNEKP